VTSVFCVNLVWNSMEKSIFVSCLVPFIFLLKIHFLSLLPYWIFALVLIGFSLLVFPCLCNCLPQSSILHISHLSSPVLFLIACEGSAPNLILSFLYRRAKQTFSWFSVFTIIQHEQASMDRLLLPH
jgi:hypothetical protein